MAWWKLNITGKDDVTDDDRAHISELILEGFTEGELNEEVDGEQEEADL